MCRQVISGNVIDFIGLYIARERITFLCVNLDVIENANIIYHYNDAIMSKHDGVSDHRPHDYLLNSKLRVTGLCAGWPVTSPHKGPITWKMFPFDDVIMYLLAAIQDINDAYKVINRGNVDAIWSVNYKRLSIKLSMARPYINSIWYRYHFKLGTIETIICVLPKLELYWHWDTIFAEYE